MIQAIHSSFAVLRAVMRWFTSTNSRVMLLCLLLFIVGRASYRWWQRESQTRELYAYAAQLGYNEDSQVLRQKAWYCIGWDLLLREECTIFLVFTTTLDIDQLANLAENLETTQGLRITNGYDRSKKLEWVMIGLNTFLPEAKYVPAPNSDHAAALDKTIGEWEWDMSKGSVSKGVLHVKVFETSQITPQLILDERRIGPRLQLVNRTIEDNIVVLYGDFKITSALF